MRRVFSTDRFTLLDARPKELYQEFLGLTHESIRDLLLTTTMAEITKCPACHSDEIRRAFEKFDMQYCECDTCHSLFINPRPDEQGVLDYYAQSLAERFWHENLARASSDFRQSKLINSRITWMLDCLNDLGNGLNLIDVYPHQDGWVEALAQENVFDNILLVHPLVGFSGEHAEHFRVEGKPLSKLMLEAQADVITLFEVVDRSSDLDSLFTAVSNALKPRGICLLTSVLASGLDIQVLWEKAANLFPPDRLNVLTVEGFNTLFDRHGFEVLEFSTPGGLDMDIISRAMQSNPEIELPRFISYLLEYRSTEILDGFQEFLQTSLLSSAGRIVIRKL